MNWQFKPDADPQSFSDFWYDLQNGYIQPSRILADPEQIKKLEEAERTIASFRDAAEDAGLLEAS